MLSLELQSIQFPGQRPTLVAEGLAVASTLAPLAIIQRDLLTTLESPQAITLEDLLDITPEDLPAITLEDLPDTTLESHQDITPEDLLDITLEDHLDITLEDPHTFHRLTPLTIPVTPDHTTTVIHLITRHPTTATTTHHPITLVQGVMVPLLCMSTVTLHPPPPTIT